MSIPLFIVLILVGLIGSAFFSGAEIAVISCDRIRMHNLAREGNRSARIVQRLLEQRRKVVTTTLLGVNFCNVGTAAGATGLFITLLQNPGAVISTVVITPLILVFGEILPKTLFRQYANGICLKIAPFLSLMHTMLSPIVWIADTAAALFFRVLGSRADREGGFVTREELRLLISEGERLGLLRSEGERMIDRAFGFSETAVRNVTVPLVDVFALEEHTPIVDALASIVERGHSRVPVYRDRVDNIIGMLDVFDVLEVPLETSVGELMRPAYYVPETKGLQELLLEMKESRIHQAVVVDEFGGASGIVTLEDAIEKIVGAIRDEFDREPGPIASGGEEWVILDARTTLADARRHAGIDVPEGDYETLGGYLSWVFGRIPEAGELTSRDGWDFEVLEATPRRILRIRVRRTRRRSSPDAV